MRKITTQSDLKLAISQLEMKQKLECFLLKEEAHNTYEQLKPLNLLISSFKDAVATSDGAKNILGKLLELGISFVVSKNKTLIQSALNDINCFFQRGKE